MYNISDRSLRRHDKTRGSPNPHFGHQRESHVYKSNAGLCVDCPKVTEDKSSESSPNSRCRANYSHYLSTKTRGSKPASQHYCSSITTVPRREGRNPRLYFITINKTQSSEPVSHTKLDGELEAHM